MNKEYSVGLFDTEGLKEEILINLTAHCDKKMNAYIKAETKKNEAARRAASKHQKIMEKYLANQNKLIAKLAQNEPKR